MKKKVGQSGMCVPEFARFRLIEGPPLRKPILSRMANEESLFAAQVVERDLMKPYHRVHIHKRVYLTIPATLKKIIKKNI